MASGSVSFDLFGVPSSVSMGKNEPLSNEQVIKIVLGSILLISSLAATGLLFPHIGYPAFIIGGTGSVIGAALLIKEACSRTSNHSGRQARETFLDDEHNLLARTEEESDEVVDCNAGHPIESQARRDSARLGQEIRELERLIAKMDRFVRENPELAQMCQEVLDNGYIRIYAGYQPPDTSHLDPENPIDQRTIRALKKIRLEAELEERQLFLEQNPEIAQKVREIQTTHPPTGKTPLLLRA